jgi:hypothetical protein
MKTKGRVTIKTAGRKKPGVKFKGVGVPYALPSVVSVLIHSLKI